MHELDRYIAEITRIRRTIQIYIELFTTKDSVNVLTKFSSNVFSVIQRSMHDEIVISLSRLYDGKGDKKRENLSQLNLVSKHENVLTEKLKKIRQETTNLLNLINIKSYRDTKVAHNNKDTLTGKNGVVKHNMNSEEIIVLLEKSLSLIIGIKAQLEKKDSVSIPVMLTETYENKGLQFIEKISKI